MGQLFGGEDEPVQIHLFEDEFGGVDTVVDAGFVVGLFDDVALAGDGGVDASLLVGNKDVMALLLAQTKSGDFFSQHFHVLLDKAGDDLRIGMNPLDNFRLDGIVEQVFFVEDDEALPVSDPKFFQHLGGDLDVLLVVGGADVHHHDQQVGFQGGFQGGLESVDKGVGQVGDEAHRVRQDDGRVGVGTEGSEGGVEGGEELVLLQNLGQAHAVHQGGFSRIGVSHQCHGQGVVLPLFALLLPGFGDLLQFFFVVLDAVADHAAIQLNLLFPLAAPDSDASLLPSQVAPHSRQSGEQILQTGDLNLNLCLPGSGVLSEYFQDDVDPIDHGQASDLPDVSDLSGRQFKVKGQQCASLLLRLGGNFFEFSGAQDGGGIRLFALLDVFVTRFRPKGAQKFSQFQKRALGLNAGLVFFEFRADDGNQRGFGVPRDIKITVFHCCR